MSAKAPPLFWVVRQQRGAHTIFLQCAQDKLYAWLHRAIAGHEGKPAEIQELGDKTARKVPKKMIARPLTYCPGCRRTRAPRLTPPCWPPYRSARPERRTNIDRETRWPMVANR